MNLHTIAIILAIILIISYFTSIQTGLYWRHTWLDIPLHFLAGAVVALFSALLFGAHFQQKDSQRGTCCPFALKVLFLVGMAALVGILWEFFEWVLDLTILKKGYYQPTVNDTLADLAMDLLGGLFTALALNFASRKKLTAV